MSINSSTTLTTTNITNDNMNDGTSVCCKCTNKLHLDHPVVKCQNNKCVKYMYFNCYHNKFSKKTWCGPTISESKVVFCNQNCFDTSKKNNSDEILTWENDGKVGYEKEHSSESIILDRITTEGNWSKYKGKHNHGITKLQIVKGIVSLFESKGVRKERSVDSVKSKINNWEGSFQSATVWVNGTGAGIKEDDPNAFNDFGFNTINRSLFSDAFTFKQ